MQRSKGTFYALTKADGTVLAGNLQISPQTVTQWHGWRTLIQRADLPFPPYVTAIRGVSDTLPNGDRLYIAENASSFYALNHLIGRVFLITFGPIILLGILGWLLVARSTLNRVFLIANISREIINGDLSRRVPLNGSGDEFDELSSVLNLILDRIEALIGNIKQVSNDISHDLRSPLARLRERLELARRNMNEVVLPDLIDEAILQVDTALSLFSAMLRISEIEAGARRSAFCRIDLSFLLQELVETYDAVAELDGKTVRSLIPPDLKIDGDYELLSQMFVNIVENAIRHCPRGTLIFIQAEVSEGGRKTVTISDNGHGIPEADRERVFGRFVRLDKSRHHPGSGLGLALVAAIATMHGFSIVLEDNGPGLRVVIEM